MLHDQNLSETLDVLLQLGQPNPRWLSLLFMFVVVVCLTVMEVKVRQIPPMPFRDTAKKMSGDKAAERTNKSFYTVLLIFKHLKSCMTS